MRDDYFIPFLSDESIFKVAARIRQVTKQSDAKQFDVIAALDYLTRNELTGKGRLKIRPLPPEKVAPYVTFQPLTLWVDDETLEFARLGDPESIYKLAHELGHILLHDHHAMHFTEVSELKLKYAQDEESAEKTAHKFARLVQLPKHWVDIFDNAETLARECNVPKIIAELRIADVEKAKKKPLGDFCIRCFNFSLVTNESSSKCTNCK